MLKKLQARILEDGTGHNNTISGSHYSGFTISNAVWVDAVHPFATVGDGSFGLGVEAGLFGTDPLNNRAYPGTTSPILFTFDDLALATSFSIQAFDVGFQGVRVQAFDAVGGLLDTDSATTAGVGGNGAANRPVLSVSGVGIKTIRLTQISNGSSDGIGWDNLSMELVPEPSRAALLLVGLISTLALRRRHPFTL